MQMRWKRARWRVQAVKLCSRLRSRLHLCVEHAPYDFACGRPLPGMALTVILTCCSCDQAVQTTSRAVLLTVDAAGFLIPRRVHVTTERHDGQTNDKQECWVLWARRPRGAHLSPLALLSSSLILGSHSGSCIAFHSFSCWISPSYLFRRHGPQPLAAQGGPAREWR